MIEFKNVTKSYAGNVALDSISFKVDRGTACGYIGPNGAGKTTTARIIVGLEKPGSGRVIVVDRDAAQDGEYIKSRVGYVPESPRLYESMTPRETIAMAAMLRKSESEVALRRLDLLSEILYFKDTLHTPLYALSKGTKQKVVISLALLFHPQVLILDEPTDGLDVQAVAALKQLIKAFTSSGGTVFYSSHLLDVVEGICSKVFFINLGKIADQYEERDFAGKRGFLENALIEHIGSRNEQQLIDAFFEHAD